MTTLSLRTRIRVLERDGYRCVYCGRTSADAALQVDHVLPRKLGGQDDGTNLVTACFECNNGKRTSLIRLPEHVSPALIDPPRRRTGRHTHVRPEVASVAIEKEGLAREIERTPPGLAGDVIERASLRILQAQRQERIEMKRYFGMYVEEER